MQGFPIGERSINHKLTSETSFFWGGLGGIYMHKSNPSAFIIHLGTCRRLIHLGSCNDEAALCLAFGKVKALQNLRLEPEKSPN